MHRDQGLSVAGFPVLKNLFVIFCEVFVHTEAGRGEIPATIVPESSPSAATFGISGEIGHCQPSSVAKTHS